MSAPTPVDERDRAYNRDGVPRKNAVLIELAIIQVLEDKSGVKASVIADGLPWSTKAISSNLRALREEGRVEKCEIGEPTRWRCSR